jgi:hypothetical protein
MAKFWTWAEIKAKVESDLDLQDEDFIRKDSNYDELLGYANEAIDEAESEIHTIYEDYFLSKTPITLVVDQEEYSMPTDIYAHKIRRVVYDNSGRVYDLQRIRDWKKFEEYSVQKNYGTGESYSYFITNSTPGEPKILLVPKSREAGANVVLWYLRQANRLEVDADVCDIPEFVHFVIQFMKVRVYEKEGHPNLPTALSILEQQRKQMTDTLTGMVPDDNNTIEADLSHYEEMN